MIVDDVTAAERAANIFIGEGGKETAFRFAFYAGFIVGFIVFEIITDSVSGGAASIAKATKVGTKVSKAAKAIAAKLKAGAKKFADDVSLLVARVSDAGWSFMEQLADLVGSALDLICASIQSQSLVMA